ncbi:hypothetical protein TNCV_4235131 [Trichonephila clavipes]|nr:hypothetical protein TNCV_4235131 [Trichonephila clavipes]
MVLKANDRRTSCPCHDEFRGPRSDYVRQVALATTTTTLRNMQDQAILKLEEKSRQLPNFLKRSIPEHASILPSTPGVASLLGKSVTIQEKRVMLDPSKFSNKKRI